MGGYNGDYMKSVSIIHPINKTSAKKDNTQIGLGCYNAARLVSKGRILACVETPDRKCYFLDMNEKNNFQAVFERPI